jgi:hypothetical protein
MNAKSILGVIIGITLVTALGVTTHTDASKGEFIDETTGGRKAPAVVSGDNVYITWWSNRTGNDEVLFRASTDSGATFSDRINLSNTTDAESVDAEIAAEGGNVMVTWWERNQTANEPVARVSTDNGATFGPTLMLATNGTIGEAAEEEPEEGG